jgi:transposase, IS30 family
MKYKQLTIEEREKIQEFIILGKSLRYIAGKVERNVSTISRELLKNKKENDHKYNSRLANEKALKNRENRGRKERLKNEKIREYVTSKLKLKWSPEQISGRIRIDLKEEISHEAIYQYIYHQVHRDGYGYLKPGMEDLRIYLRRSRKRRSVKGIKKGQRIFKPLGNSIEIRPTSINERVHYGDWEGDTVESCNHLPGVNTLLERKSGLYLVTKVKDKTSKSTNEAVLSRLSNLPRKLVNSLTLDNGSENSDWNTLESVLKLKVYYAHPYSSWERGSNENANGLLRQYFPKGTNFATIESNELAKVEYLLNTRPRKRLNYKTPLEVWSVAVRG